jgi:hypothetical protein
VFAPVQSSFSDFVTDVCGGEDAEVSLTTALLLIALARSRAGMSTSFSLVLLCDEAQYLVDPSRREM